MSPFARHEALDRVAGGLAIGGAGIGILGGLVDVAVGPSIRDWVGNKLHTSTLGLATVALGLIALAAAISWWRADNREGGRRLATVLALAIPAAICFTTLGRLWYLPGAMLLSAAAVILATSTRSEIAHTFNERRWLCGLMISLGGFYIFLGADALGVAGVLGIAGGLLVWWVVARGAGSRGVSLAVIALAAFPFAIATWWSAVTPLIALLMLALGPAVAPPTSSTRHRRSFIGPRPRRQAADNA